MIFRVCLMLALTLFAGCAEVQMRGVNLLQSSNVALDDLANKENMQHLKALGANTVAFVPFIRQNGSCDLSMDENYAADRLLRAIGYAHQTGLRVVLKPQMLIKGSWAGEIDQADESGWRCWFDAYTKNMLALAKIADESRAEMLILGTELHKTEGRAEWRTLTATVRREYRGQISYVAHDIKDLAGFTALDLMDSVAITYYPKLESVDIRAQMKQLTAQIKADAEKLKKPFWFAEIGISSRQGALTDPWLWPEQFKSAEVADPALQAEVLDGWMSELDGKWHQGILIWDWYSDAKAGGMDDTDFTIQNKPATDTASCHWQKKCR